MGLGCKRTDWPFLSIGMQSEAGSWSTDGAPWELSKAFLRASVSSGKEDIDQSPSGARADHCMRCGCVGQRSPGKEQEIRISSVVMEAERPQDRQLESGDLGE